MLEDLREQSVPTLDQTEAKLRAEIYNTRLAKRINTLRSEAKIETISLLVDHGVLVVCAGGGGIPVTETHTGWRGVEAVVDKDLSAALLARQLGAEELIMLTDVDAVYVDWETAEATGIAEATPDMLKGCDFAPGSMGPKVQAAIEFVEATGAWAFIGRHSDLAFDNPDFELLAKAFGIWGKEVRSAEDFAPALDEALAVKGPAILAVPVDYRENRKLTKRLGDLEFTL